MPRPDLLHEFTERERAIVHAAYAEFRARLFTIAALHGHTPPVMLSPDGAGYVGVGMMPQANSAPDAMPDLNEGQKG